MASAHQNLGSVIQKLRQRAGLTQDDLSDKAGLSYSTLAKIERGAIKNPSVFTVAAIAEVLGTSVEKLIDPIEEAPAKKKASSIKFLYTDMNGVLVRFFQRAFTTIGEEYGIPVDKVETTFWHYNDAANKGDLTVAEFNKAVSEKLEIKNFDWLSYYTEAVEPIKEMHECIYGLEGRVQVGILSNAMPGYISSLKKKGFIPDFDFATIVDSSEVNTIKPESRIYEIAEQKAGFSGDEILFVDDARSNLIAAERFGWRVLWFDDYRPAESVKRVEEALSQYVLINRNS